MSAAFVKAAASYHGIPAEIIARSDINTADDGVVYLTVSIPLREEDFSQIVKRMVQLQEKEEAESPAFIPDSDLDIQQWRDDYAALSPKEKGQFKSFARYKAYRQAEQFEPEEPEAVSELPAAVWVHSDDVMQAQIGMASDKDWVKGFLLQVDMLTPEQKAKYCGDQKP